MKSTRTKMVKRMFFIPWMMHNTLWESECAGSRCKKNFKSN
jgi:hypothetical protein